MSDASDKNGFISRGCYRKDGNVKTPGGKCTPNTLSKSSSERTAKAIATMILRFQRRGEVSVDNPATKRVLVNRKPTRSNATITIASAATVDSTSRIVNASDSSSARTRKRPVAIVKEIT